MLRPYSENGPRNLVDPWVIFGRDSRIVPIFSPIMSSQDFIVAEGAASPSIAEQIYGSLILLGNESFDPVTIVINSPGGDILAGFTIIQAVEHLKAKGITVMTINLCRAMSMAGIILMMGTKGHRYVLEDTLTLTHFGKRSGSGTTERDVEEMNKHAKKVNDRIYRLISENSKIPEYAIKRDELEIANAESIIQDDQKRIKLTRRFLESNVYMSHEEVLEAGMVDKVLLPGDPIIDAIFRVIKKGGQK